MGLFESLAELAFEAITHPDGNQRVIGAVVRDEHDPNDVHYSKHAEVAPDALPGLVDLRDHLTPVEDQGHLGSCTANAIAGAYEYLEKRTTGAEGRVSRLFIYYNERQAMGTVDRDSGASLRIGMQSLQSQGAASELAWPYDVSSFKDAPPEEVYREASEHTIDEFQRIPIDVHAMKVCLAEGYPFVFATHIFESFERHGTHGRVTMPEPGERDLGGHAMLCCGYSDQDQVFLVRNSWGPDWGDGGYCYFPYEYLANAEWTHDLWTVRRAHNLDFQQVAEPGQSSHPSGATSFYSS